MILVIGYGNSLCGDDGIGPFVVEHLVQTAPKGVFLEQVEWLSVHQLTPELAEPLSRARAAIFVDAACGVTPGEICSQKIAHPGDAPVAPGAFTHHQTVALLLANAQLLYGYSPVAYLYTITGQNFGLGDSFSPAVELALPDLLSRLKARITRCMNLVSLK